MNAMVNLQKKSEPFIRAKFPQMSIEAAGLLLQMSNVPELDYCDRKDLYRMNPVSSQSKIDKTVEELLRRKCLIETADNRLAVNKVIIVQSMQLVHGNLLFRMEG